MEMRPLENFTQGLHFDILVKYCKENYQINLTKNIYELFEAIFEQDWLSFLELSLKDKTQLNKQNKEEAFFFNHLTVLLVIVKKNPNLSKLREFFEFMNDKCFDKHDELYESVFGPTIAPLLRLFFSICLNRPERILEYLGSKALINDPNGQLKRTESNPETSNETKVSNKNGTIELKKIQIHQEESEIETENKKTTGVTIDSSNKENNEIILLISIYFWFIILRFPKEYSLASGKKRNAVSIILSVLPLKLLSDYKEDLNIIRTTKYQKEIPENLQSLLEICENLQLEKLMASVPGELKDAFLFLEEYPEYLVGECSDGSLNDIFLAIAEDLEFGEGGKGDNKLNQEFKDFQEFLDYLLKLEQNQESEIQEPEKNNEEQQILNMIEDNFSNLNENDKSKNPQTLENKQAQNNSENNFYKDISRLFEIFNKISLNDTIDLAFLISSDINEKKKQFTNDDQEKLKQFLKLFNELLNFLQQNSLNNYDIQKKEFLIFVSEDDEKNKILDFICNMTELIFKGQLLNSNPLGSEHLSEFIKNTLDQIYEDFKINDKSIKGVFILLHNTFLSSSEIIKKDDFYNEVFSYFFEKKPDWSFTKLIEAQNQIEEIFSSSGALSKKEKRKKLFRVIENIEEILLNNNNNNLRVLSSLVRFIKGEFSNIGSDINVLFNLTVNKLDFIKDSLLTIKEIIKKPEKIINNTVGGLSKKMIGFNFQTLQDIMKKAEGGNDEISFVDLFTLINIDRSGTINYNEFKTISKRLGMNLSLHRIKEIIASVKMESNENTSPSELNLKEFKICLQYLQNKSLFLALETLGLTKEVLILLLFWISLILLVIFAFIFVGVEAFAAAGTFGAIVNSIFPIVGGVVVSNKNRNHKQILTSDEFKSTVNKCIKIVQSMRI